jgi:hypothetical protein
MAMDILKVRTLVAMCPPVSQQCQEKNQTNKPNIIILTDVNKKLKRRWDNNLVWNINLNTRLIRPRQLNPMMMSDKRKFKSRKGHWCRMTGCPPSCRLWWRRPGTRLPRGPWIRSEVWQYLKRKVGLVVLDDLFMKAQSNDQHVQDVHGGHEDGSQDNIAQHSAKENVEPQYDHHTQVEYRKDYQMFQGDGAGVGTWQQYDGGDGQHEGAGQQADHEDVLVKPQGVAEGSYETQDKNDFNFEIFQVEGARDGTYQQGVGGGGQHEGAGHTQDDGAGAPHPQDNDKLNFDYKLWAKDTDVRLNEVAQGHAEAGVEGHECDGGLDQEEGQVPEEGEGEVAGLNQGEAEGQEDILQQLQDGQKINSFHHQISGKQSFIHPTNFYNPGEPDEQQAGGGRVQGCGMGVPQEGEVQYIVQGQKDGDLCEGGQDEGQAGQCGRQPGDAQDQQAQEQFSLVKQMRNYMEKRILNDGTPDKIVRRRRGSRKKSLESLVEAGIVQTRLSIFGGGVAQVGTIVKGASWVLKRKVDFECSDQLTSKRQRLSWDQNLDQL